MKLIFNFFSRFMPYIKGHYKYFAIAILGSLMTAGATAGVAYFVNSLLGTLKWKSAKSPTN